MHCECWMRFISQTQWMNALEDRCSPSFSFYGWGWKKVGNKNLDARKIFFLCMVTYGAIWCRCFQSTISKAVHLLTHMFLYCSCCCASNVLQKMRLYVGLWVVPMCFGMANEWGVLFFFPRGEFCQLVEKKWKFWKFLKFLYLTNFD